MEVLKEIMMHNKLFLRAGMALATFMAPVAALAQTDPFNRAKESVSQTRTAAGIQGGEQSITKIAGNLINVALGFLGILLLGYLLYAGFLWMTSGGETDKVDQARTMIKNAIIGLLIIVAAFAISSFVLDSLIKVTSSTTPIGGGL